MSPRIHREEERRRAPTSHDVAALAGVAQSTVSRALSGDPSISEPTRERVVEAARELHYSPNAMARSLITRRADRVGVFIADITNPFYPELVESLEREFEALGYGLALFSDGVYSEEDGQLDLFLSRTIDGLIFASAGLGFSLGDRLAATEAPVVFLNRHVDDDRFDRVVADNVGGGRLAAELLLELGHTRIAQISGPPQTSTARDRDVGFQAALAERGAPLPGRYHRHGPYAHATGFEGCRSLLSEDPPPTAIFCGNDVIALGAWDAAVSAGLDVPGDLSIVGFDDILLSGWESIGLTTVRQPLAAMAASSARLLVGRIESGHTGAGRAEEFPVEMVMRRSAGPPASA